jgi:hypothetical protein
MGVTRLSLRSLLMKFTPWRVQRKVRQRHCSAAVLALIMVLSVDTSAEHVFDSVIKDNPMAVKMTFIVGMLA